MDQFNAEAFDSVTLSTKIRRQKIVPNVKYRSLPDQSTPHCLSTCEDPGSIES